jgi:hypothetical protein
LELIEGRIASTFKSDMMPWTTQIEQDCDHLAAAGETEGDAALTIMARISQVAVQAAEVSQMLIDSGSHAPGALHIPLLLASLDHIKSSLSSDQLDQSKSPFTLHPSTRTLTYPFRLDNISAVLSTARVAIYELALLFPYQPTSTNILHRHKRTSYLTSCFQTCKSCTERYLDVDIVNFTAPTKLIFAYSLKVLHRLCTLQDADWDPALARQDVDLISVLQRCAVSAEEANARLRQVTGEDSVFKFAAVSMRESAANWAVAGAETQEGAGGGGAMAMAMNGWAAVGDGFEMPGMDFSEDFWMNSSVNI